MDEKDREYVRGLLIKARAMGQADDDLLAGRFIGNARDIEDAISELSDRGVYFKSDSLKEFVKAFISAKTFSFSDILGIVSNPIPAPLIEPNGSCWKAYKAMLEKKPGFSKQSIADTEKYARLIVENLDVGQTGKCAPRRGLVMGSVQSGKTANMGAVMSMAADCGINLFIVYSGVLNSLRNQTKGRFVSDLKDSITSHWHELDFNQKGTDFSDAHFETGSPSRYLVVCLKNAKRLTDLGRALERAGCYKKSMRVLIIDDEADQASPDTEEMSMTEEQELSERSRINGCLVRILFNKFTKDSTKSRFDFGSINYLCYTATPYANILNEAGKESLYPGDFVVSLPEPKNYFGIKAIFGDGDQHPHGLGIVRRVSDDEAEDAAGGSLSLSSSSALGRAIAWFVCSAAVLRREGHKKPVSMLINPSARIAIHGAIDESVERWLTKMDDDLFVAFCRKVYDDEKGRFSRRDLAEGFPGGYGELENVKELPGFDALIPHIRKLKSKIGRITSSANKGLTYHDGIHLCVDNSQSRAQSEKFFRIIYPAKEELAAMKFAPVFIVIGGSTLSRGLTLEGLCCSYFTRNVHQADTLMQMGRWFGYRAGYELLQRVWMTSATEMQFRAMARMDVALKKELGRYHDDLALKPSDYGPRVCRLPDAVHLRLASARHMQHAIASSYDFAGAGYETTEFTDSVELLRENDRILRRFIGLLATPEKTARGSGGFVWRGVKSQQIIDLIKDYHSPAGMTFSRYMKDFIPWMRECNQSGRYCRWNVALCGSLVSDNLWRADAKVSIGRISRTQYDEAQPGIIDIGSLRSGVDAIIDAVPESMTEDQVRQLRVLDETHKNLFEGRGRIGLSDVPLLLIYVIDGSGRMATQRTGRRPIGVGCDIVGLSVVIPGELNNGNHVDSVRVRTSW